MTKQVLIVRAFSLALLCIIITGCPSVWINKSGDLSASVSNVKESELHDIYTLMRANGFQMMEHRRTGTTLQEIWEGHDWGKSGRFTDPADQKALYISYQYSEKNQLLHVSINEFYVKGGGFSAEGLSRADQVMQSIKQHFGNSVKITVRSYYTGVH